MAMTTLEKVLFLKSVPMLQALPGEAVAQIAPIASEVRVDEGERFIHAGDEGHCLYVIVDGTVEVRADEGTVSQVGGRAIIGELSVLTNRPRSADCIAASPLLMLQIGKQDFWALLEERPELSTAILREVVERYI